VFGLLAGRGGIDAAEMERVFNMGVGMAAVVAADDADRALHMLAARDVTGWVLGEVTGPGDGVQLAGAHPG
jgi:phosphoribosylformylglycinamidine cyclo-ligase